MFVILSGKIRIQQNPTGGATLAELGEGATFGEMGLFRKAQRSATAIAVGQNSPTGDKSRQPLSPDATASSHCNYSFSQSCSTTPAGNFAYQSTGTGSSIKDSTGRSTTNFSAQASDAEYLSGHDNQRTRNSERFWRAAISSQGEKIMNQGEQGKEVLILLQGQLKVQINKDKGYVVLALINQWQLGWRNCLVGRKSSSNS